MASPCSRWSGTITTIRPCATPITNYKGRMAASGHYAGMYLGDPDIDFAKLAESQGVKGEKVETAGARSKRR